MLFAYFKRHQLTKVKHKPAGQIPLLCHFLPDLDNDPGEIEQSLRFLRGLHKMGWHSVVATPFVMQGYYFPNPESIVRKTKHLEQLLRQEKIQMNLEPAAEYYWDAGLFNTLASGQNLLSFTSDDPSKKFVLIETSLVYRPENFALVMNSLKQQGYSVVLSHTEQYIFLQQMPERVLILREAGVCFQVNLRSLTSEATPATRRLAEWLVQQGMVDFWAAPPRIELIQNAMQSPLFSAQP
ncbi:hypothetical protein GCM10023187_16910 [Nibrella viscosa]|uniref:protein-tyrosine-phosphatase n=1 Tax=Nibrella viscosa TaxID=1084524 RepID=A0ABP8K7V6_9BACT